MEHAKLGNPFDWEKGFESDWKL